MPPPSCSGRSPRTRRLVAGSGLLVVAAAALAWVGRERTLYDTVAVARTDVEATVTAIGTLQPRRYVDVGAQVSGQITRLAVAPGTEVHKGELLVEIDPSVQRATVDAGRAELAGLRAQLAEQQAQHRLAGQQLARQRQMAADEATRLEDLQGAEAASATAAARLDRLKAQIDQTLATLKADEARLGYTRIYAPMAGTVVSVEAREGQTLNATYQTPDILRIADLSGMTVWTEVSEADVRRVRPGMPVYFTTLGGDGDAAAEPGGPRRWQGTVRQVLPAPPQSAKAASTGATPAPAVKAVTYTALFDVDNADGELMPQMTAQVVFVTARAEGAVAVPLSALAAGSVPGSYTARVLGADHRPEVRHLRLGTRSRHQAQVLEGLKEGEQLVTGESRVGGGPRWLQW
ncbi:efflux RND transporter periplasmic adaptor subunit [Azohydromonas lata]|uniref:Efflux RND transporter periplasmic adaptor subunit n=1 Tax=Azohydromonas lata TaxID=45677 RepID=A0ABU5IRR4_9BURK|nr:efflux RND transporter periplasmic adaptor subunit [Azohydromonas lata]MDZ5461582.1 efflux RND transporter periplasmic adaptor subunit [Azohydromonas lata]